MSGVWLRVEDPRLLAHLPGANAGLGPVDVLVERELGGVHPGPDALRSSKVGNARFGGDSGTGECEEALLAAQ